MKQIIFLISAFVVSHMYTFAQSNNDDYKQNSYAPQSPTAFSFAKGVDCSVSLYTGVPDISIPMYTIEAGEINIPISLSYHASGITVAQEATRVGLGWNLNAGGMITRTIKCGDDFKAGNGINIPYFLTPEATPNVVNPYETRFFNYSELDLIGDAEPDIFFFSTPSESGKFLFTRDSIPIIMNRVSAAKISPMWNSSQVPTFSVVDDHGNIYKYEQKEETRTFSNNIPLRGALSLDSNIQTCRDITNQTDIHRCLNSEPFDYISSWYLSSIISNTNDTVLFNYVDESYQLPLQGEEKFRSIININTNSSVSYPLPTPGIFGSCSKSIVHTHRLSRIDWRSGHIDFIYSSRDDIARYSNFPEPKKLESVRVYDVNENLVKSYDLRYHYMVTQNNASLQHVFKRLMLDEVYNNLDNSSYKFTYNSGSLPAKNSFNTDYWGYSNGKNQESAGYSSCVYGNRYYPGGDKTPNFEYMKIGLLNQIELPTGGTIQYEFEPNHYMSEPYYSTNTRYVYLRAFSGTEDQYDYYEDASAVDLDTLILTSSQNIQIYKHFEYTGNNLSSLQLPYDDETRPVIEFRKLNDNGSTSRVVSIPIPNAFRYQSDLSSSENIFLERGTYYIYAYAMSEVLNNHSIDYNIGVELSFGYTQTVHNLSQQVVGSGARISKIIDDKITEYSYDDETLLITPVFSYILNCDYVGYAGMEGNYCHAQYLIQTSSPTRPLSTINKGNTYGYGEVIETHSDGTSIIYTFRNETPTHPDNPYKPTPINYLNGTPVSEYYYDPGNNIVKINIVLNNLRA